MKKYNTSYHLLLILLTVVIISGCSNYANKDKSVKNEISSFSFGKNSRVVFVGNSITHMGMFHNNIFLYHVTRFPYKYIYMFNCGVSGDVTWGVLDRMEEDILVHKPTHAVIMLGMNDVGRNWYGEKPTTNADTLKHREEALLHYRENMEKIVNIFLEKNVKVILERPTIYDQTAVLPVENNFGVNDALGIYAESVDSLAAKYNLPTVDYYGIMNRINTGMQKKDSSFTITRKSDRIHPGETGHLVMTYQFLKTENAPKYVSCIIVDADKKSNQECENCEINNIKTDKNGVMFSVFEKALPYPVKESQKEGLQLVPFINDFDVELLKVANLLPEKSYRLTIDSVTIGNFTGKQLAKGINLAEYKNTPQYVQSLQVLKVLQELWATEGKLRGMKFIEYLPFFKEIKNKDNVEEIESFMDSSFIANNYTDPYYKSQLNKFLKNKPHEKEYKEKCTVLMKKAYKTAQPVSHTFSLKLIN